MYTRPNTPMSAHRHAFTMIEIIMAMAIFLIGIIAVAAIFPVAAHLQKETVQDLTAQQVARNANAVIWGVGIDPAELDQAILDGDLANSSRVQPLPAKWLDDDATPDPEVLLTLDDRTYPAETTTIGDRKMHWVPLLRLNTSPNPDEWYVHVFILAKDEDTYPAKNTTDHANPDDPNTLPGVRKVSVTTTIGTQRFGFTAGWNDPRKVQMGDLVLDDNGYTYKVVAADDNGVDVNNAIAPNPDTNDAGAPTALYFGEPNAGGRSPTRRIILHNEPLQAASDAPTPPIGWTAFLGIVDDNGSTYFPNGGSGSVSLSGGWTYRPGASGFYGYPNNVGVDDGYSYIAGTPVGTASTTWTFNGLPAGDYRVSVSWLGSVHAHRALDAPFTVYDNAIVVLPTSAQDLRNNPNDMTVTDNSVNWTWEHLGTYSISSGVLQVSLGNNVTDQPSVTDWVIADVVRIERQP